MGCVISSTPPSTEGGEKEGGGGGGNAVPPHHMKGSSSSSSSYNGSNPNSACHNRAATSSHHHHHHTPSTTSTSTTATTSTSSSTTSRGWGASAPSLLLRRKRSNQGDPSSNGVGGNNSSSNGSFSGCSSPEKKEDIDRLPVLDEERLRELRGVVKLRDTIHSFIKHGKTLIDQIQKAIELENLSTTAKAAHALKGASKTVGAMRLSKCSELIEYGAKGGSVETCKYYSPWLIPCLESIAEEFFRNEY